MRRRDFVLASVGATAATALRASDAARPALTLGFSLYGMKSLPTVEAIVACRKIGYECTELPLMADWPADSTRLTKDDVAKIGDAAAKSELPIVALMDNLRLVVDDEQHAKNLARLERACEIALHLSPKQPPLIETILGGSPAQWEATKEKMADRLRAWVKVTAAARVPLAIKAHVANAAHLPQHITWLLDTVQSEFLVAAYDFSHFQLQGCQLEDSLGVLIKQTRFVHVKDAIGTAEKFKFVLPGEGETDYRDYFARLHAHHYQGPVMVEVSGQVSGQPGYDAVAAARKCWNVLSAARRGASSL